jgi:hypothetical protein
LHKVCVCVWGLCTVKTWPNSRLSNFRVMVSKCVIYIFLNILEPMPLFPNHKTNNTFQAMLCSSLKMFKKCNRITLSECDVTAPRQKCYKRQLFSNQGFERTTSSTLNSVVFRTAHNPSLG